MAIGSNERLLTVREVAERLRLHPITVRRHIKAGRIRAVRIGRAVRVPEAELRKFGGGSGQPRIIGEEVATYRAKSPEKLAFERRRREMTPEQWEQAREAGRRMRELRDRMPPMDISTTELVRLGRRQLEERDKRRARGGR